MNMQLRIDPLLVSKWIRSNRCTRLLNSPNQNNRTGRTRRKEDIWRWKFPQNPRLPIGPNDNDSSHLKIQKKTKTKRGRKRKKRKRKKTKQVGKRKCERKHSNWERKKKEGVYPSCLMKSNLIQFKNLQPPSSPFGEENGGKIKQVHCSLSLSLSVHYIDAGNEHQRVYSSTLLRVQTVREKHISSSWEKRERERGNPSSHWLIKTPQLKFNNDAISVHWQMVSTTPSRAHWALV